MLHNVLEEIHSIIIQRVQVLEVQVFQAICGNLEQMQVWQQQQLQINQM